jgi:hypothetical protein
MRENCTYGSEGGEAKKPSLPLSSRKSSPKGLGAMVCPHTTMLSRFAARVMPV